MKAILNPAYEAALYEIRYYPLSERFLKAFIGFSIRSNDPECLAKLVRREITVDDTIPPLILVPDEYALPESDQLPKR